VACGHDDPPERAPASTTGAPGRPLVAALGDSITAGAPLWDPDPAVREAIGPALDERSQYGYWAARRLGVRVRNCGVNQQRTDEIAARLDDCARGADALIVQGGLNDIAQGAELGDAAANLRAMVRRGKARGLDVAIAELSPWNNGYPDAAPLVERLNAAIARVGREEDVPVLPFFAALEDPRAPGRMRADLTSDGDHPSVAGHRRLGAVVRLP
jgi:lysophospholipase L1-like esterase